MENRNCQIFLQRVITEQTCKKWVAYFQSVRDFRVFRYASFL